MMSNLAKFVNEAKAVVVRDEKRDRDTLSRLGEQIAAGQAVLGELMPIEAAAREKIETLLEPLAAQQRQILRRLSGLRRVTTAPLLWQRSNGLPVFAVFNLRWSSIAICRYERDARVYRLALWQNEDDKIPHRDAAIFSNDAFWETEAAEAVLPKALAAAYFSFELNHTIRTSFDGVIPASTRAKIAGYRHMFDDVYIVAEPTSWKVHVPNPDPVVVGWDGEAMWVIDTFDLTSAEEAMVYGFE